MVAGFLWLWLWCLVGFFAVVVSFVGGGGDGGFPMADVVVMGFFTVVVVGFLWQMWWYW